MTLRMTVEDYSAFFTLCESDQCLNSLLASAKMMCAHAKPSEGASGEEKVDHAKCIAVKFQELRRAAKIFW
jgi:hypothetical protein